MQSMGGTGEGRVEGGESNGGMDRGGKEGGGMDRRGREASELSVMSSHYALLEMYTLDRKYGHQLQTYLHCESKPHQLTISS